MSLLQFVIICWFVSWSIFALVIYKKGIKTDNVNIQKHYKKLCVGFLVINTIISSIGIFVTN